MVQVFAVIGDTHCHKTSTIRALTGVGQVQRHWNVEYGVAGTGETFVQPNGLQEKDIPAGDFIADVNAADVSNVIVALRYDAARNQPDARSYLDAFRAAGWTISGYAILGPRPLLAGFANGIAVPNAPTLPSNEIASHLRNTWQIN